MNRDDETKFHSEYPEMPVPACRSCARRVRGTATCEAFPGGIPDEIMEGKNDHRAPFPGDGGLTYLPRA